MNYLKFIDNCVIMNVDTSQAVNIHNNLRAGLYKVVKATRLVM